VLPLIEDEHGGEAIEIRPWRNKAKCSRHTPALQTAYAFVRMPKPDPDMIELTQGHRLGGGASRIFQCLGMIGLLAGRGPWIAVKSVQILKRADEGGGHRPPQRAGHYLPPLDNGVGRPPSDRSPISCWVSCRPTPRPWLKDRPSSIHLRRRSS